MDEIKECCASAQGYGPVIDLAELRLYLARGDDQYQKKFFHGSKPMDSRPSAQEALCVLRREIPRRSP